MGHFNWETGDKDTWWAGPTCTFQEPEFIPRAGSSEEGDGYLIALLNHLDVLRNDILIFDALNLGQGPLAAIHLPVKLRLGLHGNFIEQREIEEWAERRREGGVVGPVKPAMDLLPWQRRMVERGEVNEERVRGLNKGLVGREANEVNGTNGVNGVNGH
jgi:carotenoid cleavage dioxygenase